MIDKIVISTRDDVAMAAFYTRVLAAELLEHPSMPGFWSGTLGGLTLILCPRAISGVDVPANNIQLRFVVSDLDTAHALALAHGGAAISAAPTGEGPSRTWDVRDPDGNSIELRQA